MGGLTGINGFIGVAVMGYGVVGKGVAHAIRHNAGHIREKTGLDIRLLHVLDILEFPGSPDAGVMTRSFDDIINDGGVSVVVETMGGLKTAFEYTKRALASGKHVVTSNKELVAESGPELLAVARASSAQYLFDASVCGGIPVITPVEECLAANRIDSITGILNGTTNYMLYYMKDRGAQFMDTLKLAQQMGFAENNPAADIEGSDACRKLAILSSVAWGRFLDWKTIHTEGIGGVTPGDIRKAGDLGRVLKLIARARMLGDGRVEAYVMPVMLDRHSPLAGVEGVNNAVIINGDLTGDVMFFGQGAGMIPTGGAIVSDIIKIFGYGRGRGGASGASGATGESGLRHMCWDRNAALEAADFSAYADNGYYARVRTPDREAYAGMLFREFPEAKILPDFAGEAEGCCVFTAPPLPEGEFAGALARVNEAVKGSETGFIARLPQKQSDG